jgi:hypothetical protein
VGILFGGKTGASALLHVFGWLTHGFLGNSTPLATGKRRFCLIDGGKDFCTRSFTFLPQRKRFLHRVFLPLKASALDSLMDKRFLIRRELHFHTPSG